MANNCQGPPPPLPCTVAICVLQWRHSTTMWLLVDGLTRLRLPPPTPPPPPPPPWLLNNLCLLLSLFFFLVFNHSRSYVCFWLTLQSTSYIPPSHPRPFTKQRKSAPSESYTNSSDKKDQKFKRKGNRGYLEPNSPMVQPNERTNATFETFAFCDNIQNLSFLRAV